jgi:hypothetical protein
MLESKKIVNQRLSDSSNDRVVGLLSSSSISKLTRRNSTTNKNNNRKADGSIRECGEWNSQTIGNHSDGKHVESSGIECEMPRSSKIESAAKESETHSSLIVIRFSFLKGLV